jgi:hypothetical protein
MEWTLLPQASAVGDVRWYSLELPRALDGIARSVVLELELEGLPLRSVAYGAAKFMPNMAYCLYDATSKKPIANRPLAMRLWEAPPGLLTPRARNARLTPDLGAGGYRLAGSTLQKVTASFPDGWRPEFEAITYLSDEDAILVHPARSGISAGLLEGVIPRHCISVSAIAFLAHGLAQPVEFAIALMDPTLTPSAIWSECPRFCNVVAWSGWRTVGPDQRNQLTLLLSGNVSGATSPLSLVLMTRMASANNNSSFAWARFTDIQIE